MSIKIIDGLCEISDRYDHYIIDIFGVLHNGIEPFPETLRTLQALNAEGKNICLLSNSPRRAHGASEQMQRIGISKNLYQNIVTSGEATHEAMRQYEGQKCWFIGTDTMKEVLGGIDVELLNGPEQADFILNSVPGTQEEDIENLKENLTIAAKKNCL